MLENLLNSIKTYSVYIVVFIVLIFVVKELVKMFFRIVERRISEILKERREKKQEKKKQKQLEKLQHAHRHVHANNWLLNEILNTRIIIFSGLAGKGKTLLMQVFSKFLSDKFRFRDLKNYRENKIMKPEYLERREKLLNDGYLPVHSINLKNVYDPITGLKVQENGYEILTQQLKANTPALLQIDEISSMFPKAAIYQTRSEKDPQKKLENDEKKEFARKLRHYDLWLFGTEQDGDDILKDIRQFGFASIRAIETNVSIAKKGVYLQKIKLFLQKWAPGWFVSQARSRLSECLFTSDRVKTFFKLLLPAFFMYERQFYINRNKIYAKIKEKYTLFKTLFEFEGKKYWLHFTNSQKLSYNTRAYRKEYDNKFNPDGTRKQTAASLA